MFKHLPIALAATMTLVLVTGWMAGLVAAAEVQEGVVVAAGNGSLAMTDIYGQNMRSYVVAPTARVMLDGNHAKLEELKMGDHALVTTRRQDRLRSVVIRVDAHSGG